MTQLYRIWASIGNDLEKDDYWSEERQWIAGNYLAVMVKQDIKVSQVLGIEKGFTERQKIGYK